MKFKTVVLKNKKYVFIYLTNLSYLNNINCDFSLNFLLFNTMTIKFKSLHFYDFTVIYEKVEKKLPAKFAINYASLFLLSDD